jgi:hypothetical protein
MFCPPVFRRATGARLSKHSRPPVAFPKDHRLTGGRLFRAGARLSAFWTVSFGPNSLISFSFFAF